MGQQAEEFLAVFNRIEKWMRDQLDRPSAGFTDMVRKLRPRRDLQVRKYHDDLLEIAQLRNAIVHDRISPDFVIAEPNEWIIKKIKKIEMDLTQPEKVIPRFKKRVTIFDNQTDLMQILTILKEKGFSQLPIYEENQFLGLVTAHGLGLWLASRGYAGTIDIKGKKVGDVLISDRKRNNYRFISKDTHVFQAMELLLEDPTIEALLITEDGQPSKDLLGLMRPKEVFQNYYEEWRKFKW
ncbi:CBS domain-containing protein [Vagococcus intermedius]|uniref:CBS domain-containing protein n=1 Tax=Vagococcus intermedius TaxID=2991418 RepID=A0AAF0I4Y7_9ENTE|nr:CBS domain-containing protein [Vagococcus intermedius]WEG72628.1 CBS domain-containing protein [Vagococcus intermedius]WEG74713.1 CBS domain-containing protein [Vagococcus intermedius]